MWIALCSTLALVSCSPASPATHCDPGALHAVRAARAARSEITICGSVLAVGRVKRSRSGTHRDFVIVAGGNERIEIDANLDIMGDLPLRRGETAIVRGEYYADPDGRDGIHWTHRTLRGNHPPGFVIINGATYQ